MSTTGKMSLTQLSDQIKAGKIETVIVAFTDHYGRLMGKRFDAEFFMENAEHGTHGCDYLLTTDMEMEPMPGYEFANWELGYGDFHLIPDLKTLRKASWLRRTAVVLCDLVDDKKDKMIDVAPRNILRKQTDATSELGFVCQAASELEYYLFTTSYRDGFESGYDNLRPVGWYLEDYHILQGSRTEKYTARVRKRLKSSGIPVENSKGEWGLGQHELNVRYSDVVEMADRHVLFKQCLKEVADQMGMSVTFMAKFDASQAGSSCHIHLSLEKDGVNQFAGTEQLGPVRCSPLFKYFLGGWIHHVPDVMPFYAPTVNSYKRFVDASWAPTRLAWSYDNRTAGFRIVGSGKSLRIECRIPGADCNPYLAFAASLASGLSGIKNEIDPPPIFEGDVYSAQQLPHVPRSLREATDQFEESTFAKSVFGDDVVKHYVHFFRTEDKAFNVAVTDWERFRYFERI